jgi:hypothetical protein
MRLLLEKIRLLLDRSSGNSEFPTARRSERGVFSFLICGAGRGGTSLLTGMLDYHNDLEVGMEHSSMACLMGRKITTRGQNMFHRRVREFLRACDKQASLFPKKFYGNKITTEQLMALNKHNVENPASPIDVLDMFFNRYLAGVKVIFILRDGRACVRSKIVRTGKSVEQACARWNDSVEVYKFLRSRHQNNICIRYEDLLTSPKEILEQICGFLEIKFQQTMLDGTANNKLRKEYRHDRLDISKLKQNEAHPSYLSYISEGLRLCGYIE